MLCEILSKNVFIVHMAFCCGLCFKKDNRSESDFPTLMEIALRFFTTWPCCGCCGGANFLLDPVRSYQFNLFLHSNTDSGSNFINDLRPVP